MTSPMVPAPDDDRARVPRALSVVPEERSPCGGASKCPGAEPSTEAHDDVVGTGELARACQTTVRTVRFYEETGLVEPLDRKDGAHRLFPKDTEQRLRLIMDLREAGLSLQEIKELFALKRESRTAHEAAHRMGDAIQMRADALQEKIAVLRRLRDDLAAMSAVLHECEPCNETQFPERCPSCDVMTRPDLPRAMRLLWGDSK